MPRGFAAGIPRAGDDEIPLASVTGIVAEHRRWSIRAGDTIVLVGDATLPPALPRRELWTLVALRARAARERWSTRELVLAEAVVFAAPPGQPAPIGAVIDSDGETVRALVWPGGNGGSRVDDKLRPAVDAALSARR